jgi:hypothetical protein
MDGLGAVKQQTILVLEHRSNGDMSELTSVTPRELYSYIKLNVSIFAASSSQTPQGLIGGSLSGVSYLFISYSYLSQSFCCCWMCMRSYFVCVFVL